MGMYKNEKQIYCNLYEKNKFNQTSEKEFFNYNLSLLKDNDIVFAEPRERRINGFDSECFILNVTEDVFNFSLGTFSPFGAKDDSSSVGSSADSYFTTLIKQTNESEKKDRLMKVLLCFSKDLKVLTYANLSVYESSTLIKSYVKSSSVELSLDSYSDKPSDNEFELPTKVSLDYPICRSGIIKMNVTVLDDKYKNLKIDIYNKTYTYSRDYSYDYANKRKITTKEISVGSAFEETEITIDLNNKCSSDDVELCVDETNCKTAYCYKDTDCYSNYKYNYYNNYEDYYKKKVNVNSVVGVREEVGSGKNLKYNHSLSNLLIKINGNMTGSEKLNLKDMKIKMSLYSKGFVYNYSIPSVMLNYSGSEIPTEDSFGIKRVTFYDSDFTKSNQIIQKDTVEINISLSKLKKLYKKDIKYAYLYMYFYDKDMKELEWI
ncbi:MAG: hypothetical protein N3E37_04465 [Candidatus Micrarchaeota archaeon]|nr:hypothetical protein [Candidatus Micrarchaeota archaeon]